MCLQADVTFVKGWIAMFELIAEMLQPQDQAPMMLPTAKQLKAAVPRVLQNMPKTSSDYRHAAYIRSYLSQGGRQVAASSHASTSLS